MTIGFFDSGLGGLTVMAEALRKLPAQDYVYMADTLHVPYGTKEKAQVNDYVLQAVAMMMEKGIDALVVACNTATSIAVTELREKYAMPIVGMEPAVKPAVEMIRTTGKRVLVFATPLTLQQPKFYALVSRVEGEGLVEPLPLPELVRYCESLQFDPDIMTAYFREKLEPYNLDDYGTIVLGCTHYPFYRSILRDMLPPHIEVIDGNAGTVRRLSALLTRYGIANNGSGRVELMCTDGNPDYIAKMETALGYARELEY
ncbi:glutamate racemase [Paenibacillus sp. NPDC058071]|uniref:glutamate racemase n=1 Tax=Paenibacillus sp. NPDC058071 TaxID=3346326 RepID=UPI0036DA5C84